MSDCGRWGPDPTSLGQFDPSAGGWGGGKGKDGKGKGKDGGKKGGKGKDGKPQPCFRWQNTGECLGRADGSCKYYHGMDRKGTGKGKKGAPQAAAQADPAAGAQSKKIDILCKHVRNPDKLGPCPNGSKCEYSHTKQYIDSLKAKAAAKAKAKAKPKAKAKAKGKGRNGRAGGMDGVAGDDDGGDDGWGDFTGWDDYSAGVRCVVADGPAPAGRGGKRVTFAAGDSRVGNAVLEIGNQKPTPANGLGKLDELPTKFWVEEPNNFQGTQFYTNIKIGVTKHECMLDGGSGVSSVTEEQLLTVLNRKTRNKELP